MPHTWSKKDERRFRALLSRCNGATQTCARAAARRVNQLRRKRALAALDGLARAEPMLVRGFREGRKTWIDVYPAGGKRMRVTHEVLEGLHASAPPPIPAAARRKCIAWRYVGTSRRCAIFANETGYRRPKPEAPPFKLRPLEGIFSK